jgi:hypothetical protein
MNQEIVNNFPNLATQLSPLAYNYLQSILNAMPSTVQPVSYSSVIGPCPGRVIACKNDVTIIETQIQNDVNLNAEEKVILLMSASVARHSYAYWTMVWRDSSDAWWELGDVSKQNPEDVAQADVKGIIRGGAWGFVLGSLGGPAGSAGGTVFGAMAGSTISSGIEIIDQIFSYF